MFSAAIIGASGYTGAELLRLLAGHPDIEVVLASADSQAGSAAADLYPSLGAAYPGLVFDPTDSGTLASAATADLIFCALPHGASQDLMTTLTGGGAAVVDLAADFRLRDPAAYPRWYGEAHRQPALLEAFAYGLPELTRPSLASARLVAAAGCYPTAASLALAPLLEAGLADASMLVVDAASGVSGAGRPPKAGTTFGAVDSNFAAYGLLDHRHTPEMEQVLAGVSADPASSATVLFTPHLAPMARGILATCYARPAGALPDAATLAALYRERYADEPFVTVVDTPPATKSTLGANTAHVMATSDPRTGWMVVLCAIDNLVKGASGQAVQCANIVLGLDETAGLPLAGVYP